MLRAAVGDLRALQLGYVHLLRITQQHGLPRRVADAVIVPISFFDTASSPLSEAAENLSTQGSRRRVALRL